MDQEAKPELGNSDPPVMIGQVLGIALTPNMEQRIKLGGASTILTADSETLLSFKTQMMQSGLEIDGVLGAGAASATFTLKNSPHAVLKLFKHDKELNRNLSVVEDIFQHPAVAQPIASRDFIFGGDSYTVAILPKAALVGDAPNFEEEKYHYPKISGALAASGILANWWDILGQSGQIGALLDEHGNKACYSDGTPITVIIDSDSMAKKAPELNFYEKLQEYHPEVAPDVPTAAQLKELRDAQLKQRKWVMEEIDHTTRPDQFNWFEWGVGRYNEVFDPTVAASRWMQPQQQKAAHAR